MSDEERKEALRLAKEDVLRFVAEKGGSAGVGEIEEEIEKRKLILEWMVENGIRSIDKVGHYIRQFYIDQEPLLKRVQAESRTEIAERVAQFIAG
jgi:hypothetical protein